jgi:hypothetical protein
VLVLALAVMLALFAIAPPVQTWFARRALADHPGISGSIGSLSAGFGRVDVADLRLERNGAVLTVPALQASVPLTSALWQRKFILRGLVAKGWTLDLSRAPGAANEAGTVPSTGNNVTAELPKAPSEQKAAGAFLGILAVGNLPYDFSLDGVNLDGDVLLTSSPGNPPVRVHVILTGKGLTAERGGELAFDAESDNPGFSADTVLAHGRVVLGMESPRIVQHLEVDADLVAKGGSLPEDIALTAEAAATRGPAGETYTLDLVRGGRRMATVEAHVASRTGRLEGSWKADLRNTDLAPFALGHPLPSFRATGEGRYDADPDLARAHFTGRLKAEASHLAVIAPALESLGAVDLDADFDVAHEGHTARVGRIQVTLGWATTLNVPGPLAKITAEQPFDLDEKTGALKVADPASDLVTVWFRRLPLKWLPVKVGGLGFGSGDASGSFAVRSDKGSLAIRPKEPLTASGVSIRSAGNEITRGLDLSLSLIGSVTSLGWKAQCSPLVVSADGRQVASVDSTLSRPSGEDPAIAVAGSWTADLDALAQVPGSSHRWITARQASGDFTASVGASTSVDAKVRVAGHDPGHSISAGVHADIDPSGGVSFSSPIKIVLGTSVADVSAEGSWSQEDGVNRIDLSLNSEKVTLDHLRLMSAAFAAAGGTSLAGRESRTRDAVPFWGNWVGSVKYGFIRLETGDRAFDYVGGVFEFEPGAIRLVGAHATLPPHNTALIEGSLAFNADAELPYTLKATAVLKGMDEASLYPAPAAGLLPPLEGRFTATAAVTGKGANLDDLVARSHGEIRLASDGGVIRLLKTTVAEAIPEVSSPVSDTLGTVGSAVGTLLGAGGEPYALGKNTVGKNADAVINFTYAVAEIGYDALTITAVEDPDHSIRLTGIEMTSPELHLKGTGTIGYAESLPLSKRPLSMELQFGARGNNAQLLGTGGLLSATKDELGYTLLNQAVHFGGTLGQIDLSQWHDMLVQAATRKPGTAKTAPKANP